MATQSNKKLVDAINDAFIEIIAQEKNKEYSKYLKAINREIVANIDTITSEKIKEIVNSQKINIKDTVLLFTVLNAITVILNNKRLTRKEKKEFEPILAVMAIYSIRKPKQFVTRLIKINKGLGLTDKEKKVKKILNKYYKQNEKAIMKSIKQSTTELQRSNRKYANNITKRIRRDIKKGAIQQKPKKLIEYEIKMKYQVKTSVIDRNLNTELHAQAETVKLEMSKEAGFTHKTWKQRSRPSHRKTCFHKKVVNKRIPIESDFRGCGLKASRPADPRLPVGERVNCECYLVYD